MVRYYCSNYPDAKFIAGVDEVGRGPLIGPVVTAAVILNPLHSIAGLTDSKKLSARRRIELYDEITTKAVAWSIGRAEVNEIDTLNILHATMLAMQRAVNGLSILPDLVLIDGNCCPDLPMPSKAIVKGDLLVAEISAASIIAKVTRDREMEQLDECYPQYGLAQHKGYPTAAHLKAIEQYGVNEHYRKSFSPVKRLLGKT